MKHFDAFLVGMGVLLFGCLSIVLIALTFAFINSIIPLNTPL